MPELPEVEVVKKSLQIIVGLKIKNIKIKSLKLRYKIDKTSFLTLINKKIISIKRISKFIIINLSNKKTILIHLGMTGKFYIINETKCYRKPLSFYYSTDKDTKHDHIQINLEKNIRLIYNDVRRFGFFKIIETKGYKKSQHLSKLGPEPLSKNFNYINFKKRLAYRKKRIKDLLMDQKFVSGIGNIYANEILFLSKLKPSRICKTINNNDILNIIRNTKKILRNSIKLGGSSIKDFSYNFDTKGGFQDKFKVYDRKNLKCMRKNCSGLIKKRFFSNRSSYYCDKCQK